MKNILSRFDPSIDIYLWYFGLGFSFQPICYSGAKEDMFGISRKGKWCGFLIQATLLFFEIRFGLFYFKVKSEGGG